MMGHCKCFEPPLTQGHFLKKNHVTSNDITTLKRNNRKIKYLEIGVTSWGGGGTRPKKITQKLIIRSI
jgi:hypothetical protein